MAVVLIHVTAGLMAGPPGVGHAFWGSALLNQAARFSLGAFVLITGVALFHAYGDRPGFSTWAYYGRRLRGVVLPYLAWSVLYALWTARAESQWAHLPTRLLLDLLSGNAMYHLYFVVLLVQFYLLFPLLRALPRRRWFGGAVVAAVLVQIALDAVSFYHTGPFPRGPLAVVFRYSDRLLPWWMGYFAIGAWVAPRVETLRAAVPRGFTVWVLVGASVLTLAWMMAEFALYIRNPQHSVGWAASEFRPSAVLYSLLVCAVILSAAARGLPGMRLWLELGRCSFGVYLAHPLLLAAAASLALRLHPSPLPYFCAVFPATLVGAYLITRGLEHLPGLGWTVGLGGRPPAAGPRTEGGRPRGAKHRPCGRGPHSAHPAPDWPAQLRQHGAHPGPGGRAPAPGADRPGL